MQEKINHAHEKPQIHSSGVVTRKKSHKQAKEEEFEEESPLKSWEKIV